LDFIQDWTGHIDALGMCIAQALPLRPIKSFSQPEPPSPFGSSHQMVSSASANLFPFSTFT